MCGVTVKISKAIASLYDYRQSYRAGDVVMFKGERLVALVDIPADTVFDPGMWKAQSIQDVLNSGGSQIVLASPYEDGRRYRKYAIVEKGGEIFQLTATVSSGEWVGSEWRRIRICDVIAENSQAIADFITREEAEAVIEQKVSTAVEEIKPQVVEEAVTNVRTNMRVDEENDTLILFSAMEGAEDGEQES